MLPCAYHTCINNTKSGGITFFALPKDERRMVWIENSGNTELKHKVNTVKNIVFCEKHFLIMDIKQCTYKKMLSKTAVPIPYQPGILKDQCSNQTTPKNSSNHQHHNNNNNHNQHNNNNNNNNSNSNNNNNNVSSQNINNNNNTNNKNTSANTNNNQPLMQQQQYQPQQQQQLQYQQPVATMNNYQIYNGNQLVGNIQQQQQQQQQQLLPINITFNESANGIVFDEPSYIMNDNCYESFTFRNSILSNGMDGDDSRPDTKIAILDMKDW